MNQLRVRYHQLKIDMFALYQATMDNRGVKVHRVDQALGEIQPIVPTGDVQLRNEDQDYVQALAEMEKKISVGEHGRRRRHLLRKLNFPRPGTEEGGSAEAGGPSTAETSAPAPAARAEVGCRELDRHSNITVLRCYRCTKRFADKTTLYQHWRDEINCHIVCLFCREEFITNAKHDQHIRLCQALVCGQCKVPCQDYDCYEQHICMCPLAAKCEPVEVLTARVQCPYCDRLFTQIHMFKRHLKMLHEVEHMQRFGLKIQRKFRPNEREFPCRQCGRTFNRVYNLKMHQLSHGRTGQYRCETCNKTFRFRSNLERHSRSHTGQQHPCRVCGQQFRLVRQLRSHMSVAHDKDSFICDVCQKECDGYQRLLSHMRTHHSQKSYSCGVCGRSFNTKHKYKEHMNVHEGRYAYECHLCSERFFTRDHLRKHYRKLHPEVKRVPRRATTRRPLEQDARQPYYEPQDLDPMISDTVTLYQASAEGGSGEPAVKFEVVGDPAAAGVATRPYQPVQSHVSHAMMDTGYQMYDGSDQHMLGEYSTVQEAAHAYTSTAHRGAPQSQGVQYYQHQQVCDGVEGAATLLSLEPATSEVPEGATVMTYIVPDAAPAPFSTADSTWFSLQPFTTPEKLQRGTEQPALLFTPDKPAPATARGLFMSPEQQAAAAAAAAAAYQTSKLSTVLAPHAYNAVEAAAPSQFPPDPLAQSSGTEVPASTYTSWSHTMVKTADGSGGSPDHYQQYHYHMQGPQQYHAPTQQQYQPPSSQQYQSPAQQQYQSPTAPSGPLLLPPPPLLRAPSKYTPPRAGLPAGSPRLCLQPLGSPAARPIFTSPQQTPILVSMLQPNTSSPTVVKTNDAEQPRTMNTPPAGSRDPAVEPVSETTVEDTTAEPMPADPLALDNTEESMDFKQCAEVQYPEGTPSNNSEPLPSEVISRPNPLKYQEATVRTDDDAKDEKIASVTEYADESNTASNQCM